MLRHFVQTIFPHQDSYIRRKCPVWRLPLSASSSSNTHPGPGTPDREGRIHEIKYDGYRTLIVIDHGRVRAYSRLSRDWTGPYRRVVDACANLGCKAALIDGEVVVQDEQGISDFEALRSAIHKARHRLVLFAFDLLHLDGTDLRSTPLLDGQRCTAACHGDCVRHCGLDPKSVSILPMPKILR